MLSFNIYLIPAYHFLYLIMTIIDALSNRQRDEMKEYIHKEKEAYGL